MAIGSVFYKFRTLLYGTLRKLEETCGYHMYPHLVLGLGYTLDTFMKTHLGDKLKFYRKWTILKSMFLLVGFNPS